MHAKAVHSPAEHICVYARVRPCVAVDSISCIQVDTAQDTIYCGGEGQAASSPHTAFLTSMSAQPSPRVQLNASTSKGNAGAAVGLRSPHPPPPRGVSQSAQSFRVDQVVQELHSAETVAFLEATARSCANEYLLEGRDVTVLCTGGQGSGKTVTAFGDGEEPGLCARLFFSLFSTIQELPGSAAPYILPEAAATAATAAVVSAPTQHTVTLSCILLQGEHVVDLLADVNHTDAEMSDNVVDGPTQPLMLSSSASLSPVASFTSPMKTAVTPAASSPTITSTPTITMDVHGDVVMRGVSKLTCQSAEQAVGFLHRCRRAQASLPSSFGHVVVVVDVTSQEVDVAAAETASGFSGRGSESTVAAIQQGRLHLVDLASVHTTPETPTAATAVSNCGSNNNRIKNASTVAGALDSRSAVGRNAKSRVEESAIRPSLTALRAVIVGLVDAAARERRTTRVAQRGKLYLGGNNKNPNPMATQQATTMSAVGVATNATQSAASSASPTLHYRHCKLTMLLKGYLGGGCHTVVIAHVRSEPEHLAESLATLRLAKQLLCVPEQSEVHRTVDLAAQVRQLQRQVAALQSDLRMQVELNKRNAVLAAEALRSAAVQESNGCKLGKSNVGSAIPTSASASSVAGMRKTAGPAPSKQRSKGVLQGITDASSSSSHSAATAEQTSATPPSLLLTWPLPPDSAPLQAAVADFIAGRLPSLPVTCISEMNTCFELLRRCVVERDMRLSAAVADLRTAQAAATAAAFWGTAATTAGASRRGSVRSSRRSSFASRGPSPSFERRRASELRLGEGPLADDDASAPQSSSSMEGCPPPPSSPASAAGHRWAAEFRVPWLTASSATPTAAPLSVPAPLNFSNNGSKGNGGGRPFQTALLEEVSSTRLTAGSGVGYGSAPAPVAPSIPTPTVSFQETPAATVTTAATKAAAAVLSVSSAERHAFAWPATPKTNKVSWVLDERSGNTATSTAAAAAAAIGERLDTTQLSNYSATEQNDRQLRGACATGTPFNLPSTHPLDHPEVACAVAACATSQPQAESTVAVADTPRRHTILFSMPPPNPQQRQQQHPSYHSSPTPITVAAAAALRLSSPTTTAAPLFSSSPSSTGPTLPGNSREKSSESLGFEQYVTETEEGRHLAELVRKEEAVVTTLRLKRTSNETVKGEAGAKATAAYEAAVKQLTRHRQALLHSFEAWYCPKVRTPAITASVTDSPPRPSTSETSVLGCSPIPKAVHIRGMKGGGSVKTNAVATSLFRPYSAASGGAELHVPRLRLRPSSATPHSTSLKSSPSSSPFSAAVAASIYRA